MCGIAGFSGGFEPGLLAAMNACLAHRGPDDHAELHLAEHRVGLAHRRLSIIDLSPRGRQPMWDVTGSAAIVYNGEIYNYRELREELQADGFRFQSDSDTEVLLNLYLRDGEAMLLRLNGIFAFAIWDARSRELFLARDGIGVKPLYWAQHGRGFLFASELKALLRDPELDRTLDTEAVHDHLVYLWAPSPRTMLRSVHKLPPGHAMIVREGKVKRHWRHYELPYDRPLLDLSPDEAVTAVRSQLAESVRKQLVADVPVGVFLSGGLDSSTITALARRALPDARLQCFTIGFTDDAAQVEGMGRDLPYARQVAEHLDVDLNTIMVGPEMVNEIEAMIYHLDEPTADPAPINSLFITRLARERGIKVLLSGAGGDDIFTGYRRHYALMQERWWGWLPARARGALRRATDRINPRGELRRRVSKAFHYAELDGDDRIASYFYWIDPQEIAPLLQAPELLPSSSDNALVRALAFLPLETHPLNRMLYLESRFFLADHNLNYADKIAMANGVEVRVPLLDPDLVELVARLPVRFKQRGATSKWVLREAMRPFLPPDVLSRPKAGFGAPLRHWLRNDLRTLVDDVLSRDALHRRGLFEPEGVRQLVEMDRARRLDAAYPIFAMMCIELWCRRFIDGGATRP